MDFQTARAEVAAQLGMDETQSDTQTLINRWLNISQQDILAAWNWSWLESTDTVATATDYTTGTVSVSAGSATLTFSASITASQANRYIQFSSADDWYKITAHTAGTDTATISPAYAQTSNLSSGTFTIRTVFYSLASTTDFVYNCKRAQDRQYIPVISANSYDTFEPWTSQTGPVRRIILWGRDSNGYLTFTPYPFPDEIALLEFRVYKKASDLSSDTDTAVFPQKYDSAWILGAVTYGYRFLDDNRYSAARRDFLNTIELLKKRDRPALDKSRMLQSIDDTGQIGDLIRFPSQYGHVVDRW